ncbi:MAG: translation initiation factor IF-6 [Euryarchaeota archaeon]|nr:translation initiation factor IF-6 [Euryarchaeota archaeon]
MLRKLDLLGNPFLGVFCRASEQAVAIPYAAPEDFEAQVAEALGCAAVRMSVDSTDLIGSLLCMNSACAIVSQFAYDREIEALAKHVDVVRIPHKLNAVGNNILLNDKGAVVHPDYGETTVNFLASNLNVDVERGTLSDMGTVGSAAIATNRGVVCHPRATPQEIDVLKKVLQVPVTIGTANYGAAQVGACVIANSKGALVGFRSTPIEIGRIEEGLYLY